MLEVHLELAGYPVTVLDTAGLRRSADEAEAEGVRRALDRAARADLRLVMVDATEWPRLDAGLAELVDDLALVAVNKADLRPLPEPLEVGGQPALRLSCRTGEGVDALLDALARRADELMATGSEPLLTRARHRTALRAAAEALGRFLEGAEATELAVRAEDLRLAARALGRITGRVGVEEVLDRIFAEFCIGK